VNQKLAYQWLDRGYGKTLIVLPGWGFDGSIFEQFDWGYDLLSIGEGSHWLSQTDSFSELLDQVLFDSGVLEEHSNGDSSSISIFGWSLGGYLANDWVMQTKHKIKDVFIVSIRPKYPEQDIKDQMNALENDPVGCLQHFYRRAFMGNREGYQRFEEKFQVNFLRKMDRSDLKAGLDYLANVEVHGDMLNSIQQKITGTVTLLQGKRDLICPRDELEILLLSENKIRFCELESDGHTLFWKDSFQLENIAQ